MAERMSWTRSADARLRRLVRDGYSDREIAESLGCSPGAVHGRLYTLGLTRGRRTTCERCDEPITQSATGRPRRFCSDYCAAFRGLAVQEARPCDVCGEEIPRRVGHPPRRYCSSECNKRGSYLAGTSGGLYRRAALEADPARKAELYEQARDYVRTRKVAR